MSKAELDKKIEKVEAEWARLVPAVERGEVEQIVAATEVLTRLDKLLGPEEPEAGRIERWRVLQVARYEMLIRGLQTDMESDDTMVVVKATDALIAVQTRIDKLYGLEAKDPHT
ncbi:MAG: hypothetical protein OXI50_11250 [Gammaproteobacteria bacterium]|nr:hypothetical protein [Gammaproteobacteria bacterium]MYC99164.1 hypothetical protein [Gammaproteobacteria bacterium]